jgi:hypothetical protein
VSEPNRVLVRRGDRRRHRRLDCALAGPAAPGVDLVFADWDDAGGAAAQLLINIVAIVCGSVTTLVVHDRAWRAAVLRRTR